MSAKIIRRPSQNHSAETLSRVVPGMSETVARSIPTNKFSKVDFPTFGRPTMAKVETPPPPPKIFSPSSAETTGVRFSNSRAAFANFRRSAETPSPRSAETADASAIPKP